MKNILNYPFIKILTLLVILLGFAFVYLAFIQTTIPQVVTPLTPEGQYRIKIAPGSNVSSVAKQLVNQGANTSNWKVQIVARGLFLGKRLKAGVYDLPPGASLSTILLKMARGDSVKLSVTLVEGWTFKQFKAAVNAQTELRKVAQSLSDKQLLTIIQAKETHPEGIFLPDTYIYEPGDADTLIYQRAYQAMQKRLAEVWNMKPDNSPLKSPYELLKLASIIEKETGHPADRSLVSAVFNNRLKMGMKLQTDPTIIYGLGDRFDGDIRKKDLLRDGPYNTYTRYGLPPTPIAMPGKDALLATVKPADSKALYFVAKGDGRSAFSDSLVEHNQAVQKYQLKK